MKATKEMKDWFGMGEYDTDAMIAMGVVTEEQIVEMYTREHGENNGTDQRS